MDATYLGTHLDYTAWATRRILESLKPLTEEEFTRDLGTSFGSIRGTLTHMFGTDLYWYAQMTELWPPYPAWVDRGGEGATLAMMTGEYLSLLERYEELAGQLRDPEGASAFAGMPVGAHGQEIPAWQVAMNIVSHATYHRGQLASLLRQLGHKPLDTDIIHFYFEADGKPWPY